MERLKAKDVVAVLGFLRECYALRSVDSFVSDIVSRLSIMIPSDITVYGELNPRRKRIRWVIKPGRYISPSMHQVYEQHIREHPFIRHYERTQDGSAVRVSDFLSDRQFHRSTLYNEFYRRLGQDREMACWLPASLPLEISFAVHRARTDFTERERILLNVLRPHLIQSYRNAEVFTEMQEQIGRVTSLMQALEEVSQGVVVLGENRRVHLANTHAIEWLMEYFGRSIGAGRRLPDILERWVKYQESLLNTKDDVPPARKPLVLRREGKHLILRFIPDADRSILLLAQEHTALGPVSLERLGLTQRETEVLSWAALGKSNGEIAVILDMSPRTVAKHLEHIYQKLGVETRTAAALRAWEFLSQTQR